MRSAGHLTTRGRTEIAEPLVWNEEMRILSGVKGIKEGGPHMAQVKELTERTAAERRRESRRRT
jgi:hypothetical protein